MTDKVRKYLSGINRYTKDTTLTKEQRDSLSKDLDRLWLSMSYDERDYVDNFG